MLGKGYCAIVYVYELATKSVVFGEGFRTWSDNQCGGYLGGVVIVTVKCSDPIAGEWHRTPLTSPSMWETNMRHLRL
jgi:hypothetical protein